MDPFATLGLPRRYELDRQQLEANYRELQRVLHPDRHAGASSSQRRMNLLKAVEVNEAYRALKDDVARAEALLALAANGVLAERQAEDPAFLMEVLELREALSEANAARDLARVRTLGTRIEAEQRETAAALTQAFASLPQPASAADLSAVRKLLGRLKYSRRFLDEVGAIEADKADGADGAG